ncbi:MAG TPA: tetratricopeptide repeat protein, partial [Opitutaceae bacterium]
RKLNLEADAEPFLRETLKIDRLDAWARWLAGEPFAWDAQTAIDVATDYARAGLFADATALLEQTKVEPLSGAEPLIQYYLASFYEKAGRKSEARKAARKAKAANSDYCFPSRLEEIIVLKEALQRDFSEDKAAYYLGNLYYDRRRYDEAISLWEKSARANPAFSIVWRNLGIAYFNVRNDARKARSAYEKALKANPTDPRLVYERDQLWKRLGIPTQERLSELEKRRGQVDQRDDATLELCSLYNQTGQAEKALKILETRKFQPWEGGEGQALGAHVRTHLALGRAALAGGNGSAAIIEFTAALNPPESLGEARHLLANQSDVWFWLGEAYASVGRTKDARHWWQRAAEARGDFQEMAVKAYSEMTYFSARALERLGKAAPARKLLRDLAKYARDLARTPAKIDYFATSLPTMLLFEDDLTKRQQTQALFMQAQAALGLGRKAEAKKHVASVLARDPSHAGAADLITENI